MKAATLKPWLSRLNLAAISVCMELKTGLWLQECAKCNAEDEGPQKGLGKKIKMSMFKGKDDGKMCKIGFEQLPPVLAIQLHRCVTDSHSLVKLETAVKVNLVSPLYPFPQNSNCFWVVGCIRPGCQIAIQINWLQDN